MINVKTRKRLETVKKHLLTQTEKTYRERESVREKDTHHTHTNTHTMREKFRERGEHK